MFGPDICGPGTRKVHVIFEHNGNKHQPTDQPRLPGQVPLVFTRLSPTGLVVGLHPSYWAAMATWCARDGRAQGRGGEGGAPALDPETAAASRPQLAQVFLPIDVALAVTQSLGLASMKEWTVWGKEGVRPRNVPAQPGRVCRDHGWRRWRHWLGTGNA